MTVSKFSFHVFSLLLLLVSVGCHSESREYLRALEANDKLIEKEHGARREFLQALTNKDLAGADRAAELELKNTEERLAAETRLDQIGRAHV